MASAPVTLFLNATQTLTASGPAAARRGAAMRDIAVREGWGVAVQGTVIGDVAPDAELRRRFPDAEVIDCKRGLLAPGFVDSHTHAVFGAPRWAEHELRATGVPYLEIARRGGGIHASVRDLRARSDADLEALARPRLARLAAGGVTTVEIKSGYGLSAHDELRTLRVIATLAQTQPLQVVATCLAAHEVPLEYRERPNGRQAWIDDILTHIYPVVAAEGLARFADVFCEPGVFDRDETRRLLEGATRCGLTPKLHADELHDGAGAALGTELGAISVDHLAAISPAGVTALASAPTVATLLPATMVFLDTGRQAPARALIDAGAAVAIASDFNPGTSPLQSFPLVLTLAVSALRMSAAEAWIAATVNGAAALGLAGRTGQLTPGFSADIAVHEVDDYRAVPYWFGERLCRIAWSRGVETHRERGW
ncbi:MAG: imidazolonepropionase [Gemmatimonadaceae bacterium]